MALVVHAKDQVHEVQEDSHEVFSIDFVILFGAYEVLSKLVWGQLMIIAVLFGYVNFDIKNGCQTDPLIVLLAFIGVDEEFEHIISRHFVSNALEGKHL
jgi:hypothetical protein